MKKIVSPTTGQFKSYLLLFAIISVVTGCSTTETLTATEEQPVNNEPEVVEESPGVTENWHLMAADMNPYYGTGVEEAYETLLADKTARKDVVVAIIDSGSDINHEDLSSNIWVNTNEIVGNGIDDDENGYVDDIHGWNFIGGASGEHVGKDTYEVTRLYVELGEKFADSNPDSIPEAQQSEFEYYQEVKKDFEGRVVEAQEGFANYSGFFQAIQYAKDYFEVEDLRDLDAPDVEIGPNDPQEIAQVKQVASIMKDNDLSEDDIQEGVDYFEGLYKYGVNPEFDPRHIVGDDYKDLTVRNYGNNDVAGTGTDIEHGTHVAGIVGAVRDNEVGMDGIADVKLMIIRAVPDGDERDKDVANSIRYAADNGADIINMSFGKGYSPEKEYVDEAVKYADSLGVLLIHAAGNDGNDIDTTNNFPSRYYNDGGEAKNWITVGASSWETGDDLPASFSNYGKIKVDLFAPGVAIYSSTPNNEYEAHDGTSMAAPVVSGLAALIMTYYPELSATDVKEILLNSVTIPEEYMVTKPGSIEEPIPVPFSQLSNTGGIVNVFNALKLAELKVSDM